MAGRRFKVKVNKLGLAVSIALFFAVWIAVGVILERQWPGVANWGTRSRKLGPSLALIPAFAISVFCIWLLIRDAKKNESRDKSRQGGHN